MSEGVDPRIRLLERIDRNAPGQPYIKGAGVPVSVILEWMAAGIGPDDILARVPNLSSDDIAAALVYGARASSGGAHERVAIGRVWIIFAIITLVAGLFLGIGVGAGLRGDADDERAGAADEASNPFFDEAMRMMEGR